MEILYSTNEFHIYRDKKTPSLFKIVNKNNHNCSSLFYSIIKSRIANSATIVTNSNNNNSSLIIKTISIKKMDQYIEEQKKINNTYRLPYKIILNIVVCLSKQLSYLLENETSCFYTFNPDNILVIDDCKFLYLSNEELKEVKNNNLYIYSPIKKNVGWLSPELQNVSSVPIITSYKTIFYSLGLFILNCLLDEPTDQHLENIVLDNVVSIKGTKLYYFLERCLHNDPNKRFLIYL